MTPILVEDPDDPRIAAFRHIRERDLTGWEGLFVAEGEVVLRTLTSPASLCRTRMILIDERRREALADVIGAADGAAVYLASRAVLDAIVGFPLHRGILALGEKPGPRDMGELLGGMGPNALVLAAAGVGNHDNIGGLFRNAAAFGADAVLLDDRCGDPFYRKSIRVSVGAVLRTPCPGPRPVEVILDELEAAGFEVLALTPSAGESVAGLAPGGRRAVLVGTEGPGLPPDIIRRCRPIGIPMSGGFDSLNVATAAAVALHALARP